MYLMYFIKNMSFFIEFSPSVIFTDNLDFEATTMGIEAREKGSTS